MTTKQVTPQVFTSATEPELLLLPSNKDHTIRMIRQTVETINDLYLRYGSDSPWPTTGLFHDWACNYCPFGPKNPAPSCPVWKGDDDQAAH